MENEEDIFKEVIVKVDNDGEFEIPKAFASHNYIHESDHGVIWLLKEKADNPELKNAKKLSKKILTNTTGSSISDYCTTLEIPSVTCEIYDIKASDYLRLYFIKTA